MNFIETIHQINMTSDHSVSSYNSFKSHFNAKSFNMFLTLEQLCEVRWSCFSVCCKGDVNVESDVNSASGENWKEPSSSKISTEASFNRLDSNGENLNANKTCWQQRE